MTKDNGTTKIKGVDFDTYFNGRVYYMINEKLKLQGMGKTLKDAESDLLSEARFIKAIFYSTIEDPELKAFLDKI